MGSRRWTTGHLCGQRSRRVERAHVPGTFRVGEPLMTDEPRLQQLLDELLDSGLSPEEVCSICPEMLPDVCQRLRQMRLVEAVMVALFRTPMPDANAHRGAQRIFERITGRKMTYEEFEHWWK